jgi:hypothetical protein
MTDLKTANKQLAEAIDELESIAHADDCREAEAIRLRLLELDERIGGRIKAKLEAHRSVALAFGGEELEDVLALQARKRDLMRQMQKAAQPSGMKIMMQEATLNDPSVEEAAELADNRGVKLGMPSDPPKYAGIQAGTLTAGFGQTPDAEPTESLADTWQKHHEATWNGETTKGDYHTRYGLTKGQIVEPVLANGVAEMQQSDVSRETSGEA